MKKIIFNSKEIREGALDTLPRVEGRGEYLSGWDCRQSHVCSCRTSAGEDSDGWFRHIQHVCDVHSGGV